MDSVGFLQQQRSCSEAMPLSVGAAGIAKPTCAAEAERCVRDCMSAPSHSTSRGSSGAGMWNSVVKATLTGRGKYSFVLGLSAGLDIWGDLFFCCV